MATEPLTAINIAYCLLPIAVNDFGSSLIFAIVGIKTFLRLCLRGELRVAGSRNMALDIDRTIANARRFMAVVRYFFYILFARLGGLVFVMSNVEC